MSSEWSLIEYRPGRYVKVTPEGDFLGKATAAEVTAWFSSQAWLSPAIPPAPDGAESQAARTKAPIEDETPAPQEVKAKTPVAHPWPWFAPEAGSRQEEEPQKAEGVLPQFDVVLGSGVPEAAFEFPSSAEIAEPEDPVAQVKAEPEPVAASLAQPEAAEPQDLAAQAGAEVDAAEPLPLVRSPARPEEAEPEDLTARVGAELDDDEREPATRPRTTKADGALLEEDQPEIVRTSGTSANGHWLWVDPRQESGYHPTSFDVTAFLRRAIALFQAKDWTGGQRPQRLAVHPDQVGDGLKAVADGLGLEVVSDPLVTPGTYRLGLGKPENGS